MLHGLLAAIPQYFRLPLPQIMTEHHGIVQVTAGTTYFPGLSRKPPCWNWQQDRIYLVNPSRLYKLPMSGFCGVDAVWFPLPSAASTNGQHPPTQ